MRWLVGEPSGNRCLGPSTGIYCRGPGISLPPSLRKNASLYMQNPEIYCSLGRKEVSKDVLNATLTMGTPVPTRSLSKSRSKRSDRSGLCGSWKFLTKMVCFPTYILQKKIRLLDYSQSPQCKLRDILAVWPSVRNSLCCQSKNRQLRPSFFCYHRI